MRREGCAVMPGVLARPMVATFFRQSRRGTPRANCHSAGARPESGAGSSPAPRSTRQVTATRRSRLRFRVAQLLRAFLATDVDGAAADGDLDGIVVERVVADGAGGFFRFHGGSPVMPVIGHAHGTTARFPRLSGNLAIKPTWPARPRETRWACGRRLGGTPR